MSEWMSGDCPQSTIAWEGCSVILDINHGDRLVFARLLPGSSIKIGKKKWSLRPLIGCPFGSIFVAENGPEGHILSCVAGTQVDYIWKNDNYQSHGETRDNRALVDNNLAQALSAEDIDIMRREGALGGQIIEALVSNSSTFEKKTSFSQEKYMLRKQKKYAPRVIVRRPSAHSICEAYFKKHPDRIRFLRADTLSLLLSSSNIGAFSDVLVVDMCGGIVTGAIAERLGGLGTVCNLYLGAKPSSLDIIHMFNFSDQICSRIVVSSLSEFCSHQNTFSMDNTSGLPEWDSSHLKFVLSNEGSTTPQDLAPRTSCEYREASSFPQNNDPGPVDPAADHTRRRNSCICPSISNCSKAGRALSKDEVKLWKQKCFSSLIVAAPEHDSWSIIQGLFPLLLCSAPFAVYHQFLEPLAMCMHKLQASKLAVGLQISEPWLREYQVLPCRTHPFVQMNAFGGYVLSGIRVCSWDADQRNS